MFSIVHLPLPPMRSERGLASGLALVVVLLAYASSWQGSFQFDDYNVIVLADSVHSLSAWWAQLGHGLRPLLKLSYLLNWTIDPQPGGFHLLNLAVHLACSGMVYLLARKFGETIRTGLDWHPIAVASALLFAVHPAHTEAVTYLSGRATSLMTLLYLCALWTYACGWRVRSLLIFLLALLVKESAIMLPASLVLWEILIGSCWRVIARRLWPWLALGVIATIAVLIHPAYRQLAFHSWSQHLWSTAALAQLQGAAWLLGQGFWPFALNIDPDLPTAGSAWAVWPQLLGLVGLLALAWWARRRRPWLSLGIGWALLHLWLFNAAFPRVDIVNERLLYWGDWALIFALATELRLALPGRGFTLTAALLAGVLGVTTYLRNEVYHSELSLWQDTAAKSPRKARVLNNLGYAHAEAGDTEKARAAYVDALRWNPDYIKARNNLERLQRQSP